MSLYPSGFNPGGSRRMSGWMQQNLARYGPKIHGDDDNDDLGAIEDGYAIGAEDDGEAFELGREYRRRVRRGEDPASAVRGLRAKLLRAGWTPPAAEAGGGGRGRLRLRSPLYRVGEDEGIGADEFLGGDSIDEVDEMELGAIDDELGALMGDDDDDGSASIGGLQSMNRRIGKLQALLSKLEAKLAATPPNKLRKRKRLMQRIENVQKRLAKKTDKFEQRAEKVASKMGVPVAALVGGSVGAAAAGITAAGIARADNDLDVGAQMRAEGLSSWFGPRQTPNAIEVSLPFEDNDLPFVYLQKPGGAAGYAGAVTVATAGIPYADFELVGLDVACTITLATATDVPPIVIITTWGISGGISQLYRPTPINNLGGQVGQSSAGLISYAKTLPSIREDKLPVGRTNTVTATVNFYQPKTNVGVIDVTLQMACKLKTTKDDNISRYRGG